MINYALTNKDRVKSRLQITSTSFDGLLDAMIGAVTERMEKMAGRRFKSTLHTQELYNGSDIYGDAYMSLIVNNAPITSLASFQYKTGSNESPTWVDFSEEDYDINESMGVIYYKGRLPKGKQNLRLTYTGGYVIDFTSNYDITSSHTLPLELTEVCEKAVVRTFKKRDSEGRSSESFQESSITWEKDVFMPEDIAIIKNYRRVGFI